MVQTGEITVLASLYEALQIQADNGGQTFLNRAMSTTTGIKTTPNIRPDVLNIAEDGTVNIVEGVQY